MKANLKLIRKHRKYSEEFKRQLVKDFESGKLSVPQLSKLHGISDVSIYNWIYKFSNFNKKGIRIVEMAESSAEKLKQLERKIRDLEQIVGKKQIKIDYLERLIDVAESELKVDIKKNSNTPQSIGSGKTPKK